uniref:RNA-dependent RNA polymerase n=1 Tax=araluen mito-like virus TaxID=2858880 RepID=A0A8F5XSP1_9VIRU|nr:RNA-dependent RNA polymerase [araluen mito-like virus]
METLWRRQNLCSLIFKLYLPHLTPTLRTQFESIQSEFFVFITKLTENRGLVFTTQHVKAIRLTFLRYISGNPLTQYEGVTLNKYGFPSKIRRLLSLDLQNPDILKMCLTLLTILRDTRAPAILDRGPIETIWGGNIPEAFKDMHKQVCSDLHINKCHMKAVEWNRFHFTTKMGPNGPALFSSDLDFEALPDYYISILGLMSGRLLEAKFGDIKMVSERFPQAFHMISEIIPVELRRDNHCSRRLSCFSDKETKSRTIAIFDYWSQTTLKPLHDHLNTILKNIPQDCTFNQAKFTEFMLNQEKDTVFCSLDLTNATDRMPIKLQYNIIAEIIGDLKAVSWEHIMVGLPFTLKTRKSKSRFSYKEEVKTTEEQIYYGAGQPMGAYSLWPTMALTHHYIVRMSALSLGIENFSNYCILGDDVVIANERVADEYCRFLSILDMPISFQKTHRSKRFFEFAKRYFYDGIEITPFSISSLDNVYHRYYLLHNFLENQCKHGWKLDYSQFPLLIKRIYQLFHRPHLWRGVRKLIVPFRLITDVKESGRPLTKSIKEFCEAFTLVLPYNSYELFADVLVESIKLIRHDQIKSELARCRESFKELWNTINSKLVLANGGPSHVKGFMSPEIPRNLGPFSTCYREMTTGSLAEFLNEIRPNLTYEQFLDGELDSYDAVSLLKLRGLTERTMKPTLLQFCDNVKVQLFAQSHLTKKLINVVKNEFTIEWFKLGCINEWHIFQRRSAFQTEGIEMILHKHSEHLRMMEELVRYEC